MSFQSQFRLMDLTALQYFARRELDAQLQSEGWAVSYHEDLGHLFMVAKKDAESRLILLLAEKFQKPNAGKFTRKLQRAELKQVAKGLGAKPVLGLFWIAESGPTFELVDPTNLQPVA